MAFVSSTYASVVRIGTIIKGILLGVDETQAFAKVEILFDENSILYNDDSVTL